MSHHSNSPFVLFRTIDSERPSIPKGCWERHSGEKMGVVVTLCGRRHLSDPVRDPLYDDPGWKMEYDFDEVRFNDVTWGAIEVDRSEADNALLEVSAALCPESFRAYEALGRDSVAGSGLQPHQLSLPGRLASKLLAELGPTAAISGSNKSPRTYRYHSRLQLSLAKEPVRSGEIG